MGADLSRNPLQRTEETTVDGIEGQRIQRVMAASTTPRRNHSCGRIAPFLRRAAGRITTMALPSVFRIPS